MLDLLVRLLAERRTEELNDDRNTGPRSTEKDVYSEITIKVGPGTRAALRRLVSEERIDPQIVVDEAVLAWAQLRGPEERRRACGAVVDIVVDRVRPKRFGGDA